MTRKLDYDKLPVVPSVIADTVARTPYTAQEFRNVHATVSVTEIEALRRAVEPFQIREFADLCEARCKAAFDAGAEWFRKIATAKGDRGRDQLYIWTAHWLVAYLKAPDQFRRDCGAPPPGASGRTIQSQQVRPGRNGMTMAQRKGKLYFVCDQKERCRVVVRARSPRHAAMIAFEVFAEENQIPARNTVTTHEMAEPDGPVGGPYLGCRRGPIRETPKHKENQPCPNTKYC